VRIDTLAIYGVGLLGGSLGLAVKARGMARRVIGIGRSLERLEKAVALGAIDEATTDLAAGCAAADWVILASTVSHIISLLPSVAAACRPDAIVTDVGSTKATIVAEAERVFAGSDGSVRGPVFVGSHPMTGGEQSGVQHASADLFEDACCIVTPTDRTEEPAAIRVSEFWRALGGRVVRLDPGRHDELIAAVSHVPHLSAVGLLLFASELGEDPDLLASLLGNGFRDTTRIAAGPPDVWREICLENRGPIADHLDRLVAQLRALEAAVRAGDADVLTERLARAREFRKRLIP
jgi:prephenate dehydrogenase